MIRCFKMLAAALLIVIAFSRVAYGEVGEDEVVALAEFDVAVDAYEKGEFDRAYSGYSEIAERFLSPELCVNAGSAAYRLGNDGEAALWFRRAVVLDSQCHEARQNLRFLKRRLGFLRFDESAFGEYGRVLPIAVWRFWCAACLGTAAICLVAAVFLKVGSSARLRLLWIMVGSGLIGMGFGIGWWANVEDRPVLSLHVVTEANATALAAPSNSAGRVVAVPPGSEVAFLEQRGSWVYVEIPGNTRGWLRSSQLQQLWPFSIRLTE